MVVRRASGTGVEGVIVTVDVLVEAVWGPPRAREWGMSSGSLGAAPGAGKSIAVDRRRVRR